LSGPGRSTIIVTTVETERRNVRHSGAAPPADEPAAARWPLAEAKLASPTQHGRMIRRPRLERALDADADVRVTLVAAPAGYGKTTAVRAWCARRGGPFAWVTLDAGDNDPAQFWFYVAEAVNRVREGLGRRALQRLRVADAAIEAVIDDLMNGLAVSRLDLILVLDDFQAVTDGSCLQSVDYAISRLPAQSRLVILTRAEPALRLARLRANGRMTEVRARALAFTPAEAHTMMVEHGGLALTPDDVEAVRRHAEGWPAALALATVWLDGVPQPGVAARRFAGDQRFVADYLTEELLASLAPDTRAFVLRAAVLGRLTPELSDVVLGRSDSAAMLADLEQRNMLVRNLEPGRWFAVHPLLSEFAEFELNAEAPGAARAIHLSAATWLRARGRVTEALGQALAAQAHDLIAEILVEHHLAFLRQGGAGAFLRWARELPDEKLLEYPVVAVGAATAAVIAMRPHADRSRYLGLADRCQTEFPERSTTYVQSAIDMVRAEAISGSVSEAVEAGHRAVAAASHGQDELVVAALAAAARALYFAGDPDGARAYARRALEHPDIARRPPGHASAGAVLALVAIDRRELTAARTHITRVEAIVERSGGGRWAEAHLAAAAGLLLASEGNLAEAERKLASSERLLRDDIATVPHAWSQVLLAEVRCRRGRTDKAAEALRAAQAGLAEFTDPGIVAPLARRVAEELDTARARAVAGGVTVPPSPAELAVLRMLATDLSAREIGTKLSLSANTINSHTRALYRKLRVGSRAEAVARATELGLLAPGSPGAPEGSAARPSAPG
jgi:LuxR family maltose regulon positive regulatory protein